jgi:hypothetical protein
MSNLRVNVRLGAIAAAALIMALFAAIYVGSHAGSAQAQESGGIVSEVPVGTFSRATAQIVVSPGSARLEPAPSELQPTRSVAEANEALLSAQLGLPIGKSGSISVTFGLYTHSMLDPRDNSVQTDIDRRPVYLYVLSGYPCAFSRPGTPIGEKAPAPMNLTCEAMIPVDSTSLQVLDYYERARVQ